MLQLIFVANGKANLAGSIMEHSTLCFQSTVLALPQYHCHQMEFRMLVSSLLVAIPYYAHLLAALCQRYLCCAILSPISQNLVAHIFLT